MNERNKTRRRTSKKKRWSAKRKIIISTIAVFALIIGILAYGYLYIKSKIYSEISIPNNIEDTEYKEVEGITNVLLIGTDGRTLDEAARADSIIIATLDNNNKNIRLTSLFRDTLVNIPGHGEAKLNAAMAYGGVELLIETIKNTYGINLDKYIIINFWGFEAIIDQIGGLEFNVEDYMLNELNKYIGESTGGNDCPVTEAGERLLNGKQALSYARIRKGVGDEFARTDRQREVLVKVTEKFRAKMLDKMEKQLAEVDLKLSKIDIQKKKFLEEHAEDNIQQVGAIVQKMEVDKAKGLKLKAKIEQDIADMKHLGLGAEIIQGTMQHVFNVKVGDKMPAVMNTEIIVEDEKIIEIRN